MTAHPAPAESADCPDAVENRGLTPKARQALEGLPPALAALGYAFVRAGHEIALVGGPVRDAFLGVAPHDLDLTTSARPEQTEEILKAWGETTWDVGRAFGTIGARKGSTIVEVTTYRTEDYEVGSRKPQVTYGDTLTGDLTRRDFTVNAMALRLPDLELVDPCGGLADLNAGVLRTPVSAEQSFDDDPLRIMRAARFAAQLGFDVEMDVMTAMEEMAPRLEIVSAERVRAELERLLISPWPRRGLELLVHTGVADVVLPELSALRETVDEHKRHKDVYEHTLTVLDQAIDLETGPDGPVPGPDLVLRLAAILHDIGKPATRRFLPDGLAHEIVMSLQGIDGLTVFATTLETDHIVSDTYHEVSPILQVFVPMPPEEMAGRRFIGVPMRVRDDAARERIVADLTERWGGQIEVVRNQEFLDVIPAGATKGSGLKDLIAWLTGPDGPHPGARIETWSLGDSWNDIPMHEAADHAVALPWSPPDVTAACECTMGSMTELVDRALAGRDEGADRAAGVSVGAHDATDEN